MNFVQYREKNFMSGLERSGLALWVEIVAENPDCTYYLGPFMSGKEAKLAKADYLEELEKEGTEVISVTISICCKPKKLTVVVNRSELEIIKA